MASDERRRVAHLLRRAGFGASPTELDEYERLGFEASVEQLLHPEAIPDDGALAPPFAAADEEAAGSGVIALRWLYRMVASPRPLEEKIAFFWHDHFATSIEKVKSEALMWRQYELLRTGGLGRFADLVGAISRDPAMLIWLDNWQSRKEAPNENFGRELLELFTLGIGNYTETDVLAATRAFTGWSLTVDRDLLEQPAAEASTGMSEDERRREHRERQRERRDAARFTVIPEWHDDGEKTFLGQTGAWNGDDIIRIATAHPACARFIAGKLFAFLVWDEPDEATVAPYAEIFAASGGDIRETVGAILRSDDFSSERAYRAKVKSPVDYLVGLLRELGDASLDRSLFALFRTLGQVPFVPPHVGGWPSGLAWVGPSQTFARANLVNRLLGGDGGRGGASLGALLGAPPPDTPAAAVDAAAERFLLGDLAADQRAALVAYLSTGTDGDPLAFAPDAETYEPKLAGLIRLITSAPAYLLA